MRPNRTTPTTRLPVAGDLWLRAFLLALSGAAALIFQVLWVKQLTLVVGIDVYAVTTGVSAFFGGLALGGLLLGRLADRTARPLRLYAVLELGVATLGVATTLALPNTARWFAELENGNGMLAWALVFAIVGLPPVFMGGILPAVVCSLRVASDRIGVAGGRLYAANTLGAILGALGSTFVLLPTLGVRGTAFVAASLGAVAAGCALWLDRGARPATPDQATQGAAPVARGALVAVLLYAIAGGIAMGYEIVWSQVVVPFMSTRAFAFSVMLATYLTGLALGSALFARRADRVRNPWGMFGLLIAAAGLVAMVEVAVLGRWMPALQSAVEAGVFQLTSNLLAGMCARFAVAAVVIVLVPTVLLGAAFPAALRLVVDAGHVGRDVGRVVAWNTLGGIAGTVITGFVLVPRFGLIGSLAILGVAASVLGLLAVLQVRGAWRGTGGGTFVVAVAAVGLVLLMPSDRLARLLVENRGGTLVCYREGRGGTVAVLEQNAGTKHFRRLYIQGVSNTGDTLPSLRYMRLQALLPLVIHGGEPQSALVIGLGTGITAGALLQYPGLDQRVVAELLPEVVEAAPVFAGNFNAASDPRLEIRLRDGRRELLGNPQTYDLITLEPPPPSASGVVNLYSTGFYELARARLNPGGILAQWLPLPTQNVEDTRSLVRSFLEVFPHVSLWTTEVHEMLLLGSVQPLDLDVARISARFNQPGVSAALREVGVASPEALLATWITDRQGLETFAGDALPVTDDRPRIEYATWVRHDELQRVLPDLIGVRTDPPVRGADEDFQTRLRIERQRLMVFYQAALNAQAGHPDLWARDMKRLFESDPENPYFRWFGTSEE